MTNLYEPPKSFDPCEVPNSKEDRVFVVPILIALLWMIKNTWFAPLQTVMVKLLGLALLCWFAFGVLQRMPKVCLTMVIFMIVAVGVQIYILLEGLDNPLTRERLGSDVWFDFIVGSIPTLLVIYAGSHLYFSMRKSVKLSRLSSEAQVQAGDGRQRRNGEQAVL